MSFPTFKILLENVSPLFISAFPHLNVFLRNCVCKMWPLIPVDNWLKLGQSRGFFRLEDTGLFKFRDINSGAGSYPFVYQNSSGSVQRKRRTHQTDKAVVGRERHHLGLWWLFGFWILHLLTCAPFHDKSPQLVPPFQLQNVKMDSSVLMRDYMKCFMGSTYVVLGSW